MPPFPTPAAIHSELLAIATLDARCRRELGRLTLELRSRKGWEKLGSPRFSDWCRERIGLSSSELTTMARAARRLSGLPHIDAAYSAGEITWTHVRALIDVHGLHDEKLWLQEARSCTGRALEAKVRALNAGVRIDEIPFAVELLAARLRRTRDFERDLAMAPHAWHRCDEEGIRYVQAISEVRADWDAQAQAGSYESWWNETAAGRRIESETAMRIAIPCSHQTRLLWLEACEYARRLVGRDAPIWDLVEAVVAEASSSAALDHERLHAAVQEATGKDAAEVDEILEQLRKWGKERRATAGTTHETSAADTEDAACTEHEEPEGDLAFFPSSLRQLFDAHALRTCHPWRLERRMQKVVRVMQGIDARLADVLGRYADTGFYLRLGYASLKDYAHACLGICPRKLGDLLSVARRGQTRACGVMDLYRTGQLTRAKVQALAPILSSPHARAWGDRARRVTLRRLQQELTCARAQAHLKQHCTIGAPPPERANLETLWEALARESIEREKAELRTRQARAAACPSGAADGDIDGDAGADARNDADSLGKGGLSHDKPHSPQTTRQMRAPRPRIVPDPLPCTVSFTGPASIVRAFLDVQTGFEHPGDRRGDTLKRILSAVLHEWRAMPGHPDPVFARDGWRCSVPGCTARAQLHGHHIKFRSQGGSDDLCNRVALCVWHHLRGVHGGTIRCYGDAPDGIHWEVGFKPDGTPIARLWGDYYEPLAA